MKKDSDVTYVVIENYHRILLKWKQICEKTTNDTDMIQMKCNQCDKIYRLPRSMRFSALMPACFICQEAWIDSFYKKKGCETK